VLIIRTIGIWTTSSGGRRFMTVEAWLGLSGSKRFIGLDTWLWQEYQKWSYVHQVSVRCRHGVNGSFVLSFSRTSRSGSYPCPSASSRALIPCACLPGKPTWQLRSHYLSFPFYAKPVHTSHTIFCCPATTPARSPPATIPPSVLALFRNCDMKSCACPLFL
jgi:hypothetical protein